MADQEPAATTILPHATIGHVTSCNISGRDNVEQRGTTNVVGTNITQNIVIGNPNSDDPIQRLLFYCALDALMDAKERHNSERFLPPRCAPETREAVLELIIRWVERGPYAPMFLWLTGSAGAGKSAICQTIAEIFQREGTLLANFFFSRGAASSGRSNGYRLIPTLIWQVQKNLPETKSKIEQAIANDLSLLTSNPAAQLATLFCTPLNQWSLRRWLRDLFMAQVRLIIIDGLDECQGSALQCDLLCAIADTTRHLALPLRFLIASRPEAHIVRTFYKHPSLRAAAEGSINLDEIEDATVAIYTFVHAKFDEIRKAHPMAEYLDPSWPPEESITFVVSKSSPQFIFASTVMNYISFPEARPDLRLDTIITMIKTKAEDDSDERPLENLDKLYRFIFSGVKAKYRKSVWIILGIIHLASRQEFTVPNASPRFFEWAFGVPAGEVSIMLIPLLSIISIPKNRHEPIKSLHASLFDFLLDPQRSKNQTLDIVPAHSFVLDYYALNSEEWNGEPPSILRGVLQHSMMLPAAQNQRLVIDRLTAGMLRCFSNRIVNFGHHREAFDMLQLVFDLVERYEANKEESDQNQLSSYEPLSSIRLPAGVRNPFISPFSKFKYCAYVALVRAVGSLGPWKWLVLPASVSDDPKMLMHLIPALANFSAKADLKGQHIDLIYGLNALVQFGDSFRSERAINFSWEEEVPAVCRKSVLRLCKRICSTPGVKDELLLAAQEVCMVWTRLGEQREGSISESTANLSYA